MVDLSCKGSESEDMTSQTSTPEKSSSSEDGKQQVKTCVDCGTSKTPLWRGGPAGPKSLCNACGIRSRKKRRQLMGVNKQDKRSTSKKNIICDSLSKKKLWVLGRDEGLQRPRKLGEEEQAAFLLMALSCGSLYYAF